MSDTAFSSSISLSPYSIFMCVWCYIFLLQNPRLVGPAAYKPC
uniref:Uncharacterized protein n=1 Tax=Anguilla anguilla TaxID=7936 RepID=A0A0E9RSC0_ANGAN